MTETRGVHVVFGAGGGAGQAVVRRLAANGATVRAVTRQTPSMPYDGVEYSRCDALDSTSVKSVCEGATVVYHCINVPYADWGAMLPGILANLIDGSSRAGATLVYCDNLYMYQPVSGPISEASPTTGAGPKGKLRQQLAETLFEAHERGTVTATCGRASDFFGPGARNTIAGQLVFPAVLAGRRAHWIGSLDAPHSMSYIDDVADGLILLGQAPEASGRIWHLPAPPPVTGREFIAMAFDVAGQTPRTGLYRRWMLRMVGLFDRQMKELVEVLYQFERPFVLDHSKFATAFPEFPITSVRAGIERSLEWQRRSAASTR